MYGSEQNRVRWHHRGVMRHTLLEESQADLANALDSLEDTRMTRNDDPALSALKDDIRRTVQNAEVEAEPYAAA